MRGFFLLWNEWAPYKHTRLLVPEKSCQIPHTVTANFNLCVHSTAVYSSFWMQSMVYRKHWSRTRESLWGEGWRKESFKPGMTNRWGCLRMLCLHKCVFGLVGYWAFRNKSTPFCVIQLHKTILNCLVKCNLFESDDTLWFLRSSGIGILMLRQHRDLPLGKSHRSEFYLLHSLYALFVCCCRLIFNCKSTWQTFTVSL